MAPTGRGSGWRDAVGMAIVLVTMGPRRRPHSRASRLPSSPPSSVPARAPGRARSTPSAATPNRGGRPGPGSTSPPHQQPRDGRASRPGWPPAYSWSADNLTFRVTTRAGVRWSDGQPFSARDVAFTLRPDAPLSRPGSRRGVAVPGERDRARRRRPSSSSSSGRTRRARSTSASRSSCPSTSGRTSLSPPPSTIPRPWPRDRSSPC